MKAHEVLRLRIQQRMKALDLTPADLNRKIGKSSTWAYGYLKGERDVPVDLLDRLSEVLDVPVPSLFDETLLSSPSTGTSEDPDIDDGVRLGQDPEAPPAQQQRSEGSPMADDLKNQLAGTLDIVPTKARKRFVEHVKDLAADMRMKRAGTEGQAGKRHTKRRAG